MVALEKPLFCVPLHSCDCHVHILGESHKYPFTKGNERTSYMTALPEDYREMQEIIGLERVVLIQLGAYGTDNSCQLDAVSYFGIENTRVVIIVDDKSVTDEQLQDFYNKGARGLRVHIPSRQPPTSGIAENLLPILQRLEGFISNTNWFLDLMFPDWLIWELYRNLCKLRVPFCFPHYGMNKICNGLESQSFQAMLSLMRDGYCWVKLSGPNRISEHATYADVAQMGRVIYETAPDHVVWGSDYPHTNIERNDTVNMFNVLKYIVPNEEDMQRILVDNPAALYTF